MTERKLKLDRADLALNICWFGIDAGWMLEMDALGIACIPPTILFAVLTFVWTDRDLDALCVTTAMAAWALMSCAWFLGDIGRWDAGVPVASACLAVFIASISIVLYRGLRAHPTARAALTRLRRLRVPRRR